jgi:hypothetical protein
MVSIGMLIHFGIHLLGFLRKRAEALAAATLDVRAMLRFSGPYTPIGEPEVRTRGYVVTDLGASLRLERLGGTLDVDLRNVLDQKYAELRASGFINPGNPRTLRVGVRFDQTN